MAGAYGMILWSYTQNVIIALKRKVALSFQVTNNDIPGIWVIVTAVQVLGKYVIIGSLDPQGKTSSKP